MGAACVDFDGDGAVDIYQANDVHENFLFQNLGGTFEEVALFTGAALRSDGYPESSMGVDIADIDGNGRPDLVIPCYPGEIHTLYLNDWPFFEDGQMGDRHTAFISVPSNNGHTSREEALNVVIHPRKIPSISGSNLKLLEVLELDAPGFPTFNPHDVWCPTPTNIPYFSDHAILSDMRSSPPCLDPPDPGNPASEPNVVFHGSWTEQYPSGGSGQGNDD